MAQRRDDEGHRFDRGPGLYKIARAIAHHRRFRLGRHQFERDPRSPPSTRCSSSPAPWPTGPRPRPRPRRLPPRCRALRRPPRRRPDRRPPRGESSRPGRGRGHPTAAAHLQHPQADAPDRRTTDDRTGARTPGRLWRRPCGAVAPVPARRLQGRVPRQRGGRRRALLCHRARTARHRRCDPLRRRELSGIDDTFVVVNGDVLTDLDLSALVEFHRSHGAEGTLRLFPVEDPSRFGVVTTDEDGRVREFIEKPPTDEAPSNLINAGTYVFEPLVPRSSPAGQRVSIERVTFPEMVAARPALRHGRLARTGSTPGHRSPTCRRTSICSRARGPDHRARAQSLGPTGSGGPRVPASTGLVRGAHSLAETRSSRATPRSGGRCIGRAPRCELGEVRDSVVMAGAVVDVGAHVAGAILGVGARIGAECNVRPGSVIGFGVELEPGRLVDGERVPG